MRLHIALAVALCGCLCLAADDKAGVIKSTAQELDSLVSQKKVHYKEIIKPGFKPVRQVVPPVDLQKIAPVVATRLNVDSKEVMGVLKDDREKLSDVVMARALEEASGKPWQEFLSKYEADQLVQLVEERQITSTVKLLMDELYTEVSFVALDAMTEARGKGSAPGASKGEDKAGKDQSRE